MKVIIYSNEKKAFWKANYMDYTNNYKEAGIYNADKFQKNYPKINFDTKNDDFMIPCESISFVKTMLNKWIKDLSVCGKNTKAIVRAEMKALLEELNRWKMN